MVGLLGVLIRATRAGRVLEIGTGTGASGLEIAAALPPDGRLITLERDAAAAMEARAAFAAAGCERRVTVMIGDAARYLHKIAGPFDLTLQDGDPSQYDTLHERLVSLVAPGGLLVTRNLTAAGDYNKLLAGDARLMTAFLDSAEGLALSVKRLDLVKVPASTESGEAPRRQGATTENIE
jgi:caffeoyl-CoA O-methyltransferase